MTAGSAYADACSAKLTGLFTSFQATKMCQTFGGSGSLIPASDNAYDLGSSTFGFRNAYIDTQITAPLISSGVNTGGVAILGGASNSAASGSRVLTEGITAAGTGDLTLSTSSGATADAFIDLNGAGSDLTVRDLSAVTLFNITQAGAMTTNNTFTSSRTTDLGWSAVNVANQACNTTCTSACVFGMNTGALGNFVGCADATADTCICAGAS